MSGDDVCCCCEVSWGKGGEEERIVWDWGGGKDLGAYFLGQIVWECDYGSAVWLGHLYMEG